MSTVRTGARIKALRLNGPFPQQKYVREMIRQFGRQGDQYMDAVDRWLCSGGRSREAEPHYNRMARNPRMADYACRHSFSALYRSAATQLLLWGGLHGKFVIDVGCGFGHFTQLLARIHPSSRFVGWDRFKIVSAAAKLWRSKPLPNLEFSTNKAIRCAADVALLLCVTHEAFFDTMEDQSSPAPHDLEFARNVYAGLRPGGTLITVNRFPFPEEQVPRLDYLLSAVGLEVFHAGLPARIVVKNNRILPVRCYRKST